MTESDVDATVIKSCGLDEPVLVVVVAFWEVVDDTELDI